MAPPTLYDDRKIEELTQQCRSLLEPARDLTGLVMHLWHVLADIKAGRLREQQQAQTIAQQAKDLAATQEAAARWEAEAGQRALDAQRATSERDNAAQEAAEMRRRWTEAKAELAAAAAPAAEPTA